MRPLAHTATQASGAGMAHGAGLVATILACVVALAGCGSTDSAPSAAASRASDATATAAPATSATTSAVGLGDTVTGEAMAGTVLAAMQEAGSFHLTRIVDQGDLKTGTEQDVKLIGDTVLTSSSTDMGGLTVDLVTDSATTYARSETLFQTPKWVEITAESPTPVIASLAEQLQQTQDTVSELSSTLAASKEYTATGTETKDGVDVTVYEGELPTATALAKAPDELRTLAADTAADQGFPVTLLVDSQGRLREMTLSFAFAGAAATGISTFTDYGKDFGIAMPTGDDIAAP